MLIAIFSLLPRVGAGDSVLFMLFGHAVRGRETACLLGNCTSLAFDYVARQKLGGANMNYFVMRQLPVLPPALYNEQHQAFIVPRTLELACTAWDI